ncbi:DUF4266 domain-containing protein [Aureitalea marina]|uniref:DUF4266 domain-containing protein n=1 Tax=Aureitalea marina TaxID=930804 RepID=A0A2S7KMZ6_9FLAO|nr:DUF4266 domain-containing protein [Aureitalea marina]PQB03960.1 hypothetical protein BST85_02830 [Aureitalea marina]
MRRLLKIVSVLALIGLGLASCSDQLKPYERVYVDDTEMQLAPSRSLVFQHYVHSIREGAVTASAKKGSGGCGCN